MKTVDGDTIDCIVDLGFGVKYTIRVRFSVVDTPERNEVGWSEATAFTRQWFEKNPKFILRTEKDKAGGFGRWLGTPVSLQGEDLIKVLLDRGIARYHRE